MKKKASTPKTVRRGPDGAADSRDHDLADQFAKLGRLLHERGHLDAEDIVYALGGAVVYGDDPDVIDRFLRATKPPKTGLLRRTHDLVVRYVEGSRRKPKVWKTDKPTGHDDESIVIAVAHFWTGALGVPSHAPDPDPAAWVQELRADEAKMARLLDLGTRNASKLAWAVHKALGYPDADTEKKATQNAARQQRFKAKKALPPKR